VQGDGGGVAVACGCVWGHCRSVYRMSGRAALTLLSGGRLFAGWRRSLPLMHCAVLHVGPAGVRLCGLPRYWGEGELLCVGAGVTRGR
jgi:hypothetical protein